MRKCTYCGKEYPDTETRCSIDGEPLKGGEESIPPVHEKVVVQEAPPSLPTSEPEAVIAPPLSRWTDRQLRIFEIVLVCAIAFGGGAFSSLYLFSIQTTSRGASSGSTVSIGLILIRQVASLGLVWYVLARRSRTFSDLGFACTRKDIVWSIPFYFGGIFVRHFSFRAFNYAIGSLTANTDAYHLPSGHAPFIVQLIFRLVNPFFEELIVRAYLLTEVRQLTGSATKAVILSTLVQTSYHLYQGGPSALSWGIIFLLFSIYYAKTGRIATIILVHLYFDMFGSVWLFSRH